MTRTLRRTLHFSGLAALALATAGCGNDEPSARRDSSGFSLFDPIGSGQWPGGIPESTPEFSEAGYLGDALPPLPEAAPMVRRASHGYGYAPDYYADHPVSGPVYYDAEPSDNSYAWLALASALGGVLGDAPPDYYFDYDDGVEPWVWETGDRFVRYAEPLDYGYRYYYYSPGRSYPFLVRDPYYSYGYYDDRVVVIYDNDGRVLDGRRSWRQRQAAQRYYARAHELNQAWRQRPHHGVAAPLWAARRPLVERAQRQWDNAREHRAGWRAWDRRNDRKTGSRWAGERAARHYAAQRFAGWRSEGFRGQTPKFYAEARRSPQLQRVAQQRIARRAAIAQHATGRSGTDRNVRRDHAAYERTAARQQRFAAQRQAQSPRDRSWLAGSVRQKAAREERVAARNANRAGARHQAQAFRSQRQEARAQQRIGRREQAHEPRNQRFRAQARGQRAQAMAQAREPARRQSVQARSQARQEVRMRRAQAGAQAREQARVQRSHAQTRARSQPREHMRAQRAQAMAQARQQRTERRSAQQARPRQDFRVQRQQARQDFRAQRQAQVRQSGGGGGGHREARRAERQQRGNGRMH